MQISRRRALATALLAAPAFIAGRARAQVQNWPQRPVKFVIPFGPGAGADIGARLIQEKLSTRWGKPVVIDNRPGGDSIIAIQAVLSANDDHTFLWGPSGNFIVHPYLYQKLSYNPDDILPIASFSSTVLSVAVPTTLGIDNLADFVKRARAEAGKFNSAAVPGITELAFDYFAVEAGLTFTKVPYRDIVQAVNDLSEGRLQVYSSSYAIQRPQREAGRIKVLVQMGRARAPSLPDIPTRQRRASRPWKWRVWSASSAARRCRPSCAKGSAPTSSRRQTTATPTPSSTPPRRRRRAAERRNLPTSWPASARRSPRSPKRSISNRRGKQQVHASSSTDPASLRASMSRCACAASTRG
jgi:tripartite-type tricarboxylate transporter receptor subunit TctC